MNQLKTQNSKLKTPPTLLVLAPYATQPPQFGGALRVANLCRELAAYYTVEQFAQQVQRENIRLSLKPVIQQPAPGYTEYSARDPLSILLYGWSSIVLRSQPFWQSWALRATAPHWLKRQLREAAIVQVEHPWQFAWARRHTPAGTPVVLATHNVEASLYTTDRIAGPRWLAHAAARLIEAEERWAVQQAELVLACSEADREQFARRYGLPRERCVVVPNGVDCRFFAPVTAEQRQQRKREHGFGDRQVVAFAGSSFPPNVDAVREIVGWAEGWPDDNVVFLVVGTVGKAFADVRHPRLHFTGQVADVRPWLEAADVAVNPMLVGSGTNLKQLEYMALGLPTIATPVGARGIALTDGVEGFVRPLELIPSLLRDMLADASRRKTVGTAGCLLVEQHFDWAVLAHQLAVVYHDLRQIGPRSAV